MYSSTTPHPVDILPGSRRRNPPIQYLLGLAGNSRLMKGEGPESLNLTQQRKYMPINRCPILASAISFGRRYCSEYTSSSSYSLSERLNTFEHRLRSRHIAPHFVFEWQYKGGEAGKQTLTFSYLLNDSVREARQTSRHKPLHVLGEAV